jgi:hypothetical protein
LFITSNPTCTKAALNLLGHDVGGLRLPLVEATERELAIVGEMLERHHLLPRDGQAPSGDEAHRTSAGQATASSLQAPGA